MASFINEKQAGNEFELYMVTGSAASPVDPVNGDLDTIFTDLTSTIRVRGLRNVNAGAEPNINSWAELGVRGQIKNAGVINNTLSAELTIDEEQMFAADVNGTQTPTPGPTGSQGLWLTASATRPVAFRYYWFGSTAGGSTTNKYYTQGFAYIGSLSPVVDGDSGIWTTPISFEIIGETETVQVV